MYELPSRGGLWLLLVVCEEQVTLNDDAYRWLAIIAAIVTTTMQVQDMEDQEGDRVRGRTTMPLLLGDTATRYVIAVTVPAWSFLCPAYWRLDAWGFILPGALGVWIARRTLLTRSVSKDEKTWKLWNSWMVVLYVLPVWKDIANVTRSTMRNVW